RGSRWFPGDPVRDCRTRAGRTLWQAEPAPPRRATARIGGRGSSEHLLRRGGGGSAAPGAASTGGQPVRLGRFEFGAFGHPAVAHLLVTLTIKENLAIDERGLGARVDRERVTVPDHHIGILAHLNRADLVVDAELAGRIDGDKRQRLGV